MGMTMMYIRPMCMLMDNCRMRVFVIVWFARWFGVAMIMTMVPVRVNM